MEKLVYLSWKENSPSIDQVRTRLLEEALPSILSDNVRGLIAQVADLDEGTPIPKERFIGRGREVAAAVSIWVDSYDERSPIEAAIRSVCPRTDGYLVTESIPQACADRDWPDGTPSPGVTQFSFFPKPERLTEEAFFHAWHDIHTPFSASLHPLRWSYTRNVVARVLTEDSPPLRAIVEERFRTLEDFADTNRYFGSMEVLKQAAKEASDYSDFETMNSTAMTEYILKSGGSGPVW